MSQWTSYMHYTFNYATFWTTFDPPDVKQLYHSSRFDKKTHLTQTPICTHTVCWPETSVLWFRSTCYIYSWTFWDPIKLITALIRCVAIKKHTQKHADNRQIAHSGNMGAPTDLFLGPYHLHFHSYNICLETC